MNMKNWEYYETKLKELETVLSYQESFLKN